MTDTIPALWEHQKQGIERALAQDDFAFFFEAGTGKTRTTIDTLRTRFNQEKRVMRTVIITPLITVNNWKNEWLKYSKIDPSKVVVLDGTGVQRTQAFINAAIDGEGVLQGKIFIMNYESLLMEELFDSIEAWNPEILVVDESHRAKNPSAKRTKKLLEIRAKMAKKKESGKKAHCFILSGTPVLQNEMDLFSQFAILDNGATFGKNFFVFRAQYFYDKNAGMPKNKHFPDWRIKPASQEKIKNLIAAKSMSVRKEECLTLPPLVKIRLETELSKDQKKAYDEMRRDFITYVNDKACVAQLAITKALRLQTIISGFIKHDDGSITRFADPPRRKVLTELLTDLLPQKVIIWTVWTETYSEIKSVCESLKVKYVEIHGAVSNKDKFAAMESFQNDPEIQVLIGNPRAGGIGVNLVEAPYAIYYSRNFSLEDYLQSEARNYRGGSEKHSKITHYDIVVPKTIDEIVLDSLKNKRDLAEKITDLKNLL